MARHRGRRLIRWPVIMALSLVVSGQRASPLRWTFGRFELGRTSLRQLASTCGAGADAVRREPGASGASYLVTRLEGGGCAVWHSGPFGSWQVLTAIELLSPGSARCEEALPCSPESAILSALLRSCPQGLTAPPGATATSDGGVTSLLLLKTTTLQETRIHEFSGLEFQRTNSDAGTCSRVMWFTGQEEETAPQPVRAR